MTEAEWENLCQRCGQCCFEKSVEYSGRVVTSRIPCQHLDIIERNCRVYDKRFDVGEGCLKLTPDLILEFTWLPEDCAYVRYVKNSQST